MTSTQQARRQPPGIPILTKTRGLFVFAISEQLKNKYCFKKLNEDEIKDFHDFIEQTVGNQQSITDVDKRYLRSGPSDNASGAMGCDRPELH